MNTAAQKLGQLSRTRLRERLGEDGFKKHMTDLAKKPRKRAKKKGYPLH